MSSVPEMDGVTETYAVTVYHSVLTAVGRVSVSDMDGITFYQSVRCLLTA